MLTTVGYPLLMSFVLCFSFHLGKRKFGILSVVGASYLTIHAITAILPNESLIPTLPFYILNILPILASDILLSFSANRVLSVFGSGSILVFSFLMIQYPLITYVYNEVFTTVPRGRSRPAPRSRPGHRDRPCRRRRCPISPRTPRTTTGAR